MCPLRLILIFLSAALAGFFVIRNLKSQPQEMLHDDNDDDPLDSINPPSADKSSKAKYVVESESIEDRSGNKPHRSMWVSNGKGDASLETKKYATCKFRNAAGSSEVSDGKLKTKGEVVDRTEFVKLDGGGNDLKKKFARSKSDSSKHFDQNQSKSRRYDVSIEKAGKKTVQDKKSLGDDSVVMDDQPRKRKRIRLDPHDISNKRLDDGIVINENKEKKEDLEKDVKLSQNAQFCAIQPSPSIFSFVEDNLLGRRQLIELRRSGYNIDLSAPLDNIPPSTSSERERIEESVKECVSTRVGLKQVCLLIGTKWGMKPRDYEHIDLMERSQTEHQIVLTKMDVVFPIDVARRAMQIEEIPNRIPDCIN